MEFLSEVELVELNDKFGAAFIEAVLVDFNKCFIETDCTPYALKKYGFVYFLDGALVTKNIADELQAKLVKAIEQRDECIKLWLEEFTADESQIADVIREYNEELESL